MRVQSCYGLRNDSLPVLHTEIHSHKAGSRSGQCQLDIRKHLLSEGMVLHSTAAQGGRWGSPSLGVFITMGLWVAGTMSWVGIGLQDLRGIFQLLRSYERWPFLLLLQVLRSLFPVLTSPGHDGEGHNLACLPLCLPGHLCWGRAVSHGHLSVTRCCSQKGFGRGTAPPGTVVTILHCVVIARSWGDGFFLCKESWLTGRVLRKLFYAERNF